MQVSQYMKCQLSKGKHHHKFINNLSGLIIMENVEPNVQKAHGSLMRKFRTDFHSLLIKREE